jgi:hypothetical protein
MKHTCREKKRQHNYIVSIYLRIHHGLDAHDVDTDWGIGGGAPGNRGDLKSRRSVFAVTQALVANEHNERTMSGAYAE